MTPLALGPRLRADESRSTLIELLVAMLLFAGLEVKFRRDSTDP